jgi:hypothetical protein
MDEELAYRQLAEHYDRLDHGKPREAEARFEPDGLTELRGLYLGTRRG